MEYGIVGCQLAIDSVIQNIYQALWDVVFLLGIQCPTQREAANR